MDIGHTLTKEEFKLLYIKYFDSIRNYIYYRSGDTEIAVDIAQETFMKIWQKQYKYHEKKSKSLLYKIAKGLFVDFFRRQKIKTEYLQELKFNLKNKDSENYVEYLCLKNNYEKSLARLPEKQRIVFLMSRKDELRYDEIAERLNISKKAIEKRMSLAIATLKKSML